MTAFEGCSTTRGSMAGDDRRQGNEQEWQKNQSNAAAAVADTAQSVKRAAMEIGETVKDNARGAIDQAKQGAVGFFDNQKNLASDRIDGLVEGLRQAAQCMGERDQRSSQFLDQAANRVGSASSYLREHDLGDILRQVDRYGRQHPMILLGGMLLAGALAARFLKASQERSQFANARGGTQPWNGEQEWNQGDGERFGRQDSSRSESPGMTQSHGSDFNRRSWEPAGSQPATSTAASSPSAWGDE